MNPSAASVRWLAAAGALAVALAASTFEGCAPADPGTALEEAGTDGAGSSGNTSGGASSGNTSSGNTSSGDGAPAPGPPNLLKNGELDVNCANWSPIAGEASVASIARTGAGSCRFCMGTRAEAIFEQKVDLTVKAGDEFAGELWLRAADTPSSLVSAGLLGTAIAISDDVVENAYASGPSAPDESWARVPATFTAQRDRAALWMRLRLQQKGDPADAGGVICVYIDDAALRRAD